MLFLDFGQADIRVKRIFGSSGYSGQADIRNPLRYLLDSVKYLSPASGNVYPGAG